jgi:hypothetical protein
MIDGPKHHTIRALGPILASSAPLMYHTLMVVGLLPMVTLAYLTTRDTVKGHNNHTTPCSPSASHSLNISLNHSALSVNPMDSRSDLTQEPLRRDNLHSASQLPFVSLANPGLQ